MADVMKLLPCPFCGSRPLSATENAGFWWVSCTVCDDEQSHGTKAGVIAAWNRRASPPARGEAPAEGAGERTLADCLDVCSGDHASAWKLLTGATDADLLKARRLIEERNEPGIYDYLLTCKPFTFGKYVDLALRNRTSEPDAGAVAWTHRDSLGALRDNHVAIAYPSSSDLGSDAVSLFTHPAPATADKLRVALEALEKARDAFAEIVTGDIHHSGPNIDTDVMREGDVSSTWVGDLGRIAKRARQAADAALAALRPQTAESGK